MDKVTYMDLAPILHDSCRSSGLLSFAKKRRNGTRGGNVSWKTECAILAGTEPAVALEEAGSRNLTSRNPT